MPERGKYKGGKAEIHFFLNVLYVLIMLFLAAVCFCALFVNRPGKGIFGISFGVIRSESMLASGYDVGDVALLRRADEYAVGDVIAFYRTPSLYADGSAADVPDGALIWIHQIVDKRTDADGGVSYLTKGTSNSYDDVYYVPQDFVIGKSRLLPDAAGGFLRFCATSTGIIVLVIVPCGCLLLYLAVDMVSEIDKLMRERVELKYKKHGRRGGDGRR